MNLDQVAANFDIVSCSIRKIEADCRMHQISDKNRRKFSLDIRYRKPEQKEDKKYGGLLVVVEVFIDTEVPDNHPDHIYIALEGAFSSPASVSDEDFEELLNINGGSVLYAIARAKIETISATIYQSGKILLPMVNIVQYFEEKSKEQESET